MVKLFKSNGTKADDYNIYSICRRAGTLFVPQGAKKLHRMVQTDNYGPKMK